MGDFGVFTACIDTKENNSLRFEPSVLMPLSHRMHMLYWTITLNGVCLYINHTIWSFQRLQCYYQDCSHPPYKPFSCEFKTSNGGILATMKNVMCKNYTVPLTEHSPGELQETGNVTNFTCTLTRNKRTETKNITIDYKTQKEKRKYSLPSTLTLPLDFLARCSCPSVPTFYSPDNPEWVPC